MFLKDKKILLGITGSIAAYKTPDLIRLLRKNGAEVEVMVTTAALEFVTETTLTAVSGFPVIKNLFGQAKQVMPHLQHDRKADLILIAPATADILAKFAGGFADDIISATVLAATMPVLIAPAMNTGMWNNPLMQENVSRLKKYYTFIEPETGVLACGDYGKGKLPDLDVILGALQKLLTATDQSHHISGSFTSDLCGKRILLTAGATREYLDSVRYLSNASSGKMALELALEAQRRGAELTLIKAFTEVDFDFLKETGAKIIDVVSAQDMTTEVLKNLADQDVLICPAAIADYYYPKIAAAKIKKKSAAMVLKLSPTVDLLKKVSALKRRPYTVGFALEDKFSLENARQKFLEKKLDLLILNTPQTLGKDNVNAFLLHSPDKVIKTGLITKQKLSRIVFDHIVKSF